RPRGRGDRPRHARGQRHPPGEPRGPALRRHRGPAHLRGHREHAGPHPRARDHGHQRLRVGISRPPSRGVTSCRGPPRPPKVIGMTSADEAAPALTSGAALLRAPADRATAHAVAALAVGWLWALTAGLVVWVLVLVSAALVPALGVGLPLLAISLRGARAFATAERTRIAVQTGVVVPAPAPGPAGTGRWERLREPLGDGRAWSAALYTFVL